MAQKFSIVPVFLLFVLPALSLPQPFPSLPLTPQPTAFVGTAKPTALPATPAPVILAESSEALAVTKTQERAVPSESKPDYGTSSVDSNLPPPSSFSSSLGSMRRVNFLKVPTGLGETLGTVGLETPEFQRRCHTCCSESQTLLIHHYYSTWIWQYLQGCTCSMDTNAPVTSHCPRGTPLGFAGNPASCFNFRCAQMVSRAGPCYCLSGL